MNKTGKKIRLNIYSTALLIAMLFFFSDVHAQITDTLKSVEIQGKQDKTNDVKINTYAPGQLTYTIDKQTLEQYKFQNMASMLSQQVPVFVKSYGLNNVATLNFRGASAAQSQVYWNGVPIQNAALGIADVSLLPVSLMNKVNVVYGSSAALLGSGNVGGALLVENDLPVYMDDSNSFRQSVSAVVGSYGQYQAGIKSELATKKFSASIDAFGQTAKNNFTYTDNKGDHTMNNAQLQSGVGLFQAAYRPVDNQTITARVWYQQYYREIPPALFESSSVKNQRDESLRTMLEWKKTSYKTVRQLYAKLAYVRDYVWYRDTAVFVDSRNFTNQVYGEVGTEFAKGNHELLVFTPVQFSWIDRVTQNDRFNQNRYALALAYKWRTLGNKLQLSASARGEVVNDNSFLLPGINAAYKVNKYLSLRANVQRTYRVPTLNELYYSPGGNPSLKPEQGWNEDVGYTVTVREYIPDSAPYNVYIAADKSRKLALTHSLSLYNRVIKDWIIWLGGAIWTPHNIASVHSRGLQTENTFTYRLGAVKLHLMVNAAYTLASTTESYLPGDGSIGKQIPYTPLYNAQGNIGATWKRLYVNYNHIYTGLRYVTTDESFLLPAYTLGNLQVNYSFPLGNNTLQVIAQCNNIWNVRYMVVNARPMPGVNWLAGVSYSFGG